MLIKNEFKILIRKVHLSPGFSLDITTLLCWTCCVCILRQFNGIKRKQSMKYAPFWIKYRNLSYFPMQLSCSFFSDNSFWNLFLKLFIFSLSYLTHNFFLSFLFFYSFYLFLFCSSIFVWFLNGTSCACQVKYYLRLICGIPRISMKVGTLV